MIYDYYAILSHILFYDICVLDPKLRGPVVPSMPQVSEASQGSYGSLWTAREQAWMKIE